LGSRQGLGLTGPVDITLRNPVELARRLELTAPGRLLLIDAPDSLRALAQSVRNGQSAPETVEGDAIRSIKEPFDGILLWREERPGSQAILTAAAKRLAPGGVIWVVVALRKVTGVKTPAIHRLDRDDVVKAFAREGLVSDREVRVTAWHAAHRFARSA
jgi:hypothetical protein